MRKSCEECPWKVKSKNNTKMIKTIERFVNSGIREDKKHKCHMIDSNIWSKPNESNICIGSIN
jgi:hypothetical protein